MFTGRVREVGVVRSLNDTHIEICAPKVAALLQRGGSVAVSGVRLIVTEVPAGSSAPLFREKPANAPHSQGSLPAPR